MKKDRLMFMIAFCIVGFLTVFIASLMVNELLTSLFRAVLASVIAMIIGIGFYYLWKWISEDMVLVEKGKDEKKQHSPSHEKKDSKNYPDSRAEEELDFSEENIKKTSEYVKDLMNK